MLVLKRDDQPRFNLIAYLSKYSETVLKIISDGRSSPEAQLENILVISLAQQRYLQEEYANLLVNTSFNSQTAKLFCQLQKNTSLFPAQSLANLQAAATISAAASSQSQTSNTNRGSSYTPGHSYRGGRGSYRGGRSWRGGRRPDMFHQLSNSNVPSHRPHSNEDE